MFHISNKLGGVGAAKVAWLFLLVCVGGRTLCKPEVEALTLRTLVLLLFNNNNTNNNDNDDNDDNIFFLGRAREREREQLTGRIKPVS